MPRVASPAATHIGRLLASARKDLGLTQDQVGALAAMDSANYRAYENGRALPSIHSLLRLAWALDLAPGQLLDGLTPEHFARAADGRRRAS